MSGNSNKQENYQQKTVNEPWAPTQPALGQTLNQVNAQWGNVGLSGNEQAALSGLSANAQAGNPYAGQIGGLADDLLGSKIQTPDRTGMVQGAYDELRGGLLPYTTMDTNPYSNEAFTTATGFMSDDITDRIKSSYAGAGYSPVSSGDFSKQLGEGISRGVAPAWLQASNDLEGRKLGAISGLYGAGNTTAGLLSSLDQQKIANDQTALGNRMQGIDVARSAMLAKDSPMMRQLEIEAQRRGIPVQNIAQLANLIIPMAQLGGTQNTEGQKNTSQSKSPLEQAIGWSQVAGNVIGMGKSAATGGGGGGGWGNW